MASPIMLNVGQQECPILIYEKLENCDEIKINFSKDDVQSKKLGEEGVQLILENNVCEALKYFIKALAYNPIDHRHFLNRCYCYLRLNENKMALSDAEYVIERSRTDLYLFLARLRAGQASFGLKKYHQAEIYLQQALAINPVNVYARRELIRVQVRRIVYNGFNERDAVLALKIHPTTLGAINYLSTKAIQPLHLYGQNADDDFNITYHDLNDVYYSSDEDDDPSNFEFLNNISGYQPGKIHFNQLLPIISRVKNKSAVNIFSVWVGNLSDAITEDVLQDVFSQLGNVTKVYRPLNANYAFVNFDNYEVVQQILKISTLCVLGRVLPVQAAYIKF